MLLILCFLFAYINCHATILSLTTNDICMKNHCLLPIVTDTDKYVCTYKHNHGLQNLHL